ncbi:MAG: M28 family peptidase [Treponema sp.]|jgi:hypothetical protein|nr:M28 family peptidase [Treponema sp.]
MPISTDWIGLSPYDRFNYFIAPKVNRFKALIQIIELMGFNSLVMDFDKNKHFFIFPPGKKLPRPVGSALPKMGESPYILVAHYDRVDGSPGANDNSIAVFHLLRAAVLLTRKNLENWMIIFTDKEELTAGESLIFQGSYKLAQKLKAWGFEKAKIFNFDACGTGDTLVFSNTADAILKSGDSPNVLKIKTGIQQLRYHALETASLIQFEKFLIAPAPVCDDMGFLRAGLAAQTVTMLPSEEADQFEEVLRKYPEFTDSLLSGGIKNSSSRRFFPATWKNLNGPADTPSRLTPQHFEKTVNFIVELCR